ncbi:hypothetical protein, partial [Achromobacter dolens]|uniref:hypothetical protein n=1 Tax=Achromobacter dolens TaxID=1287738 RepID=UPI0031DFD8FA
MAAASLRALKYFRWPPSQQGFPENAWTMCPAIRLPFVPNFPTFHTTMSQNATSETLGFQAEVKQLLHL